MGKKFDSFQTLHAKRKVTLQYLNLEHLGNKKLYHKRKNQEEKFQLGESWM